MADMGGDAAQVRTAYAEILASAKAYAPQARITGVSVHEMVGEGVEVIVGVSCDPQLGPVLLFGSGGVMVEVYNDVALRRCPITRREAQAMIAEVKGAWLLQGFRGRPAPLLPAALDISPPDGDSTAPLARRKHQMSRYAFKPEERPAVYAVHGPNCYLCRLPVVYKNMHVDHVLPETLLDDAVKLQKVLSDLGLPLSFELNTFENWLPAHSDCNLKKNDLVFEATPLIAIVLKQARDGAANAIKAAAQTVTDRKVTGALLTLEKAAADDVLDSAALETLAGYFMKVNPNLLVAAQAKPEKTFLHIEVPAVQERLLLTPRQSVTFSAGTAPQIVTTARGTGIEHWGNPAFQCPVCSSYGPWSGARCLNCGQMSDPDC
jgi:5-methylcytosine-specific restriction endonuclease McrA